MGGHEHAWHGAHVYTTGEADAPGKQQSAAACSSACRHGGHGARRRTSSTRMSSLSSARSCHRSRSTNAEHATPRRRTRSKLHKHVALPVRALRRPPGAWHADGIGMGVFTSRSGRRSAREARMPHDCHVAPRPLARPLGPPYKHHARHAQRHRTRSRSHSLSTHTGAGGWVINNRARVARCAQ